MTVLDFILAPADARKGPLAGPSWANLSHWERRVDAGRQTLPGFDLLWWAK